MTPKRNRLFHTLLLLTVIPGLSWAQTTVGVSNDCQLKVKYHKDENGIRDNAYLYLQTYGESMSRPLACKGELTYTYISKSNEDKKAVENFDIKSVPFQDTPVMLIKRRQVKIVDLNHYQCK